MGHEGWLWKLGSSTLMGKSYKKRWFVLQGAMLTYFDSEAMAKPLGSVNLKACTNFGATDPSKHTSSSVARFAIFALEVISPSRTLVVIPESLDEQRLWTRQIMRQVPQSALSDTLPSLKGRKAEGVTDSDDSDAGESKRSRMVATAANGGTGKRVRLSAGAGMNTASIQSISSDGTGIPLAGVLRQQVEQQEEIDDLRAELAQLRTDASRRGSNASSIGAPLLISDSDGDISGLSRGGRGFLDSEDDDDDDDDLAQDATCCCGLCCRFCGTWNLKVLYLAIANFVVFALGLIILIMAVVAMKNKAQFKQILPVIGIYALLGTGVLTVLAAPGGTFCATRYKSGCGKMGLLLYCGLLAVLVIAQTGTGALMTTQSIMLKKFHVNTTGEVSGAKKGLKAFLDDVCHHCCHTTTISDIKETELQFRFSNQIEGFTGARADPAKDQTSDPISTRLQQLRGRFDADVSTMVGLDNPWSLTTKSQNEEDVELGKSKKDECSWIPAKIRSKCSTSVVGASGCDKFLKALTKWLQSRILPVSLVCLGVVVIEAAAVCFALRLVSPWCCSAKCLCCCCVKQGSDEDGEFSDEDDFRQRRGSGRRGGGKKQRERRRSRRASTSSGFY